MKPWAIAILLCGCSSLPTEVNDIGEMWSFAREHRQYERPDSGNIVYVADPAAECRKNGTPEYTISVADNRVGATPSAKGCTPLGLINYSILYLEPTAYDIAHEAAHRVYGDWHPGYYYFTQRELAIMRKP